MDGDRLVTERLPLPIPAGPSRGPDSVPDPVPKLGLRSAGAWCTSLFADLSPEEIERERSH